MVPDSNMVEIRSLNRDFHFIQLRSAQGSGCIGFEFRAEGEERIFFDKVNSQCDTRHVSLFNAPNDICHDGIDPVDIALGELEGIEGATAFDVKSSTIFAIPPLNRLDGPVALSVAVPSVAQEIRAVHGRSLEEMILLCLENGVIGNLREVADNPTLREPRLNALLSSMSDSPICHQPRIVPGAMSVSRYLATMARKRERGR
jgi:hypothetical protein